VLPRIERLTIQERNDQLLDELSKIKGGLQKLAFIQWTAQARALVLLAEVPLSSGFHISHVQRRKSREGLDGTFFYADAMPHLKFEPADFTIKTAVQHSESIAITVVRSPELNRSSYVRRVANQTRMRSAQPQFISVRKHRALRPRFSR
jgi:hypothetical protein